MLINDSLDVFTYHTVFKCCEVTLLLCVSEKFDVSLCLPKSVSGLAGVGHALENCAAVQSQEAQLDHTCTWIVKLQHNN